MKYALMLSAALTAFSTAHAQAMEQHAEEAEQQVEEVGQDIERHAQDAVEATENALAEADMDRDPFTDDHSLVEAAVYGSAGTHLGEIERVRLDATGHADAIVVEYGGVLDVGGREVLIEAGDYMASNEDDTVVVTLSIDRTEFEALPAFDEDEASDYPLSDGSEQ